MKKLFHPLIPLFVLLFFAGKYSYDNFFAEKYDDKTLSLLQATKSAGENVSSGYLSLSNKVIGSMHGQFIEQLIRENDPKVVLVQSKLDLLKSIYQKYEQQMDSIKEVKILYNEAKTNIKNKDIANQNYSIQNLKLQTLFTDYLKEIKAVDNFIYDKYKDYVFKENQTDKELKNNYLQGRKAEILIHLASFKAELNQIYVHAVISLVEEYFYFPFTDKFYRNSFFEPIIKQKNHNYFVEIDKINPFNIWRDTTELRSQIEANVNYYFDEKGFLVINEKDFDSRKLEWKWFLDEGSRETQNPFLEYGKEGFQYEK